MIIFFGFHSLKTTNSSSSYPTYDLLSSEYDNVQQPFPSEDSSNAFCLSQVYLLF